MAEELLNIEEQSPMTEAPIADGKENLKLLHSALSGDTEYVDLVPKEFDKFIEQYKDPQNATLLFQSLRGDTEYSDMIPSDPKEAASMFGVSLDAKGLGKPSAAPSQSADGGSAMKGRGVELRSTLPTTLSASDVQNAVKENLPAVFKILSREGAAKGNQLGQQYDEGSRMLEQMSGELEQQKQEYERLLQEDPQSAQLLGEQYDQQLENAKQLESELSNIKSQYDENSKFVATMNAAVPNMALGGNSPLSFSGKTFVEQAGLLFTDSESEMYKSAWNTIVPSMLNMVGSLSTLHLGLLGQNEEAEAQSKVFEDLAKESIIPTFGKAKELAETSVLDDLNEYNVHRLIGALGASVVGTLTSGSAMGAPASMMFNASLGYGTMYGWMRDAGLSTQGASLASLPVGVVYGYLGDKGVEALSGILAKETFKKAIISGVKELGKDATPEAISKLFFRLVKEQGKTIATGAVKETAQELTEYSTEFGTKALATQLGIAENFNNEDLSWGGFIEGAKETAAISAASGGILAPLMGATANKTLATAAAEIKNKPELRDEFLIDLNTLQIAGKVTKEQGDEIVARLDKAIETTGKIPNTVTSTEAIAEATQLIEEKEELSAQVESIEPAMAKPITNRIAEIDQRLSDIAEGKAESKKEKTLADDIFVGDTKDEGNSASIPALESVNKDEKVALERPYTQFTSESEKQREYNRISGDYQKVRELINKSIDAIKILDNSKGEELDKIVVTISDLKSEMNKLVAIDENFFKDLQTELYKDGNYDYERVRNNYLDRYSEDNRYENKVKREFDEKRKAVEQLLTQPQPQVKGTEQKSEQLLTNKNQENEKPSKEANGEILLEGVRETGNENQGQQDSEQLRSQEEGQVGGSVSNPALKDVESTAKALEGKNVAELEAMLLSQIAGDRIIGKSSNTTISEAYHKAKADDSNPELVTAVEQLLTQPQPQASTESQVEPFPAQEGSLAVEEALFRAHPDIEEIYIELSKAVNNSIDEKTMGLLKRNPSAVMVEKSLRMMEKKGIIKIDCK